VRYLSISKIPLIEEAGATGEVAETYDKIRGFMNVPSVGPGYMALANSPAALSIVTDLFQNFMQQTILPPPLLFMIHYAISTASKCLCCSEDFKDACRSVGVDETMLEAMASNLEAITPKRTQEIIRFAVKCALEPLTLTEADYDGVRDQGVTEQELVEIIVWAGYAVFNDTVSDAAKVDAPHCQ
jgi:alkylhydroperoxidase family enzyme